MGISKVIFGKETLIDLTNDTVEKSVLLSGYTAHGKDGEEIEGSCVYDANTSEATATAAEILDGKTAYAKGSELIGSMTNNGAVTGEISSVDEPYVIPNGYHDGSGTVSIDDISAASLIADNIREGIDILGITGTMSGSEDVKAQSKEVIPTTSEQIILPDTAEGYNYLASVTIAAIPYDEASNSAGGITVTIG